MNLKLIKNETEIAYRTSKRSQIRAEVEAHFERRWRSNPDQFNPLKTVLGRQRIEKTWNLLEKHVTLKDLKGVDLGCGFGFITQKCEQAGSHMTAVDISEIALQQLKFYPTIECKKQWIPHTMLPDTFYDFVLCLDLIAYIPREEYRLLFSELARITKKEGKVIISTPLDVNTDQPLQYFLSIVETELIIDTLVLSYNGIQIRLLNTLKKKPWSQKLFYPLIYLLESNALITKSLEKLTEFIYGEEGISHIILIAHLKPLLQPLSQDLQPVERKPKKSIWE